MQLDPKGIRAGLKAYNVFSCGSDVDHVRAIVRAYLEAAPSPSPAPGVVEAVAYAYVVDGSVEEVGWGKAPHSEDQSLVLLYDRPHAASPDRIREALVAKAEADGMLSVEDINAVFASLPAVSAKSNLVEAALRYARISILSGTGTNTAIANIDAALASLSQPAKGAEGERP